MKASKKTNITKLPKEIKMFSKSYSIIYHAEASPEDKDEGDILFGRINFASDIINIYNTDNSSKDEILHTLWHEILHALCINMGIDFRKDTNERVIDSLALGIFHITSSNKF